MSASNAYDYIIIGAGSAGCVLANRLSEDPNISVCLIEAGKKDDSVLIRMPNGVGDVMSKQGPFNWGFWTTPQAHMNDRKMFWPRGRGWGGSSSINGMLYIRGHARDYDQWRQTGLKGWGFNEVLPYFKKSEGYGGGGDDFHGGEGPLKVYDLRGDKAPFTSFLKAGEQAGYPMTPDFNGVQQEGFGRYQVTIHEGQRWSTSMAYLRPVVKERPNLTVRSAALVSRVLFRGGKIYGVETVKKRGAQPEVLLAGSEVILSAGAVQSPQILMLSGIGAADEVRKHGVTMIADVPGVGKNLQDHLDITVIHRIKQKISAYSLTKGLRKPAIGLRWLWDKGGLGSEHMLQTGAFLKTREGLDRPDMQIHFVNALMLDHAGTKPPGDGLTFHACQLRPDSRGTIELASNDPFDHPLIDPNYLATETDRTVMRESVKILREICAQDALSAYCNNEFMPAQPVTNDAEIDAFIREKGETIYHPVGTVKMGIHDDAPLDGELKVRGVEGLRVVDASVMPTLIGGNTNAPTIMIAEKAADMILGRPALTPENPPAPV
ncbi:MAG: choline dehydrogenase [Pseudomonadota bacterium]